MCDIITVLAVLAVTGAVTLVAIGIPALFMKSAWEQREREQFNLRYPSRTRNPELVRMDKFLGH